MNINQYIKRQVGILTSYRTFACCHFYRFIAVFSCYVGLILREEQITCKCPSILSLESLPPEGFVINSMVESSRIPVSRSVVGKMFLFLPNARSQMVVWFGWLLFSLLTIYYPNRLETLIYRNCVGQISTWTKNTHSFLLG